jgi:hypothetical protein
MNIPQGSENDSAAPWNETRQKKTHDAHYVSVEIGNRDGNGWFRVYLPSNSDWYERRQLARSWCVDNGYEHLENCSSLPKGVIFCDTDECYE